MVLAVPEPAAAAMSNLKILYQLGALLGSSFAGQEASAALVVYKSQHVKADRWRCLARRRRERDGQLDHAHRPIK